MEKFSYSQNCCLATPTLGIVTASSATVKYGATFTFKANGRISPSITTANAPSLATAVLVGPFVNGSTTAAPTKITLATGYARTYALVGTLPINGTITCTPTYSWIMGNDRVVNDCPNISQAPTTVQANQAIIGWVDIINGSGSDFTPGTTALDLSNVTTTYINNFGIAGV